MRVMILFQVGKKRGTIPWERQFPAVFLISQQGSLPGIKLNDFNCGLKAYRKDVVKNIEVYGEMHRFIPMLVKEAGFTNIGEKVVEHRKENMVLPNLDLNGLLTVS
jgi:hypothetical protein